MKTKRSSFALLLTTTLICLSSNNVLAEKAPLSKQRLQETATHIVVGEVQAIYSRSQRKGDYEYMRYLAEVKIDQVEKGKGPSDLIYVRFLSIKWKGKGLTPPGPGGHYPRPESGSTYRFYLAQNASDGFTKDNNDGGFNVIYGNGVEVIKE